jgi:hypothetical protein
LLKTAISVKFLNTLWAAEYPAGFMFPVLDPFGSGEGSYRWEDRVRERKGSRVKDRGSEAEKTGVIPLERQGLPCDLVEKIAAHGPFVSDRRATNPAAPYFM